MFFLVDCNQFYVSCEQVFNPRLRKKPVVVLSNNDGCVVARSKEAKALKIPMGAPFYQYADLFRAHRVHVLSSNYALYGDMSQRVMHVLSQFASAMEEYSIDEAFLRIPSVDPLRTAQDIRRTVLQWTGIPVSIGIGSTKTLSKVANDISKKNDGIFLLPETAEKETLLERLDVEEIWGIGKRLGAALRDAKVLNARMLKDATDSWLQNRFSVNVLRTAYELRGISALSFHELPVPRKSITCSRSFGSKVETLTELQEALATYTATAAEKLRGEKLLPTFLTVFLSTSPFSPKPYGNSVTMTLDTPTTFTPTLTQIASQGLRKIYRPGYQYKKVGIVMGGFFKESCYQPDLFCSDEKTNEKQKMAISALDRLNARYGDATVRFAAEGIQQRWKMKRGNVSPRYTTSWDELLTI